jgi:ribosomal protein S18 acetylase RimI-like enzyme
MSYEAATWRPETRPPAETVLADPRVARYLTDWGRPGDAGVICEEDATPVGAAWYRLFPADDPGYGFVAADVPELSIAVAPGARGRGIGTQLLDALVDAARAAGHPAVSLSVEPENPARRLYERAGFLRIDTDDGALTMALDLRRS